MSKKIIGIIIGFVGLIIIYGSLRLRLDIKPLGFGIMLLIEGLIIAAIGFLNRAFNWKMFLGLGLLAAGIVSIFATIGFIPDYRPITTMSIVGILGVIFLGLGFKKANVIAPADSGKEFNIFGIIVAAMLFIISIILFPQINWQHPKDPAAVMMLTFLTGLSIVYAIIKNHPNKKLVAYAGLLAVINFILIPIYEAGFFDWLGRFYRLFVPVYTSFDSAAQMIEYALIGLTIILVIYFSIKKIKVGDYGRKTLIYFLLQIVMAIFLFEMLGLPAGFLAGDTTRSDLLVTDTNAVMSTFGMVFIAVSMYIAFQLFPFWVVPILAGLWWVLWKPWFLHHPDPASFRNFQDFLPAAAFLFLTGLKRVALPMVLLLLFFKKNKKSSY